jgi:hypothetical protein
MNDSCGPAAHSGSKIILLHQQGSPAGAGALACHGDAVDAAANHHYVKVLGFE